MSKKKELKEEIKEVKEEKKYSKEEELIDKAISKVTREGEKKFNLLSVFQYLKLNGSYHNFSDLQAKILELEKKGIYECIAGVIFRKKDVV